MNIFITGGTSGIGLETGILYQKEGHQIGVCSIETEEEARSVIPPSFSFYQADVTDKTSVHDALVRFAESKGSLDIVIANAGISMDKAHFPDFERGRKVIMVNVIGILNTFEPALAIMRRQGYGHLVGISSVSGITGMPGMAVYGASKAAVRLFCESLEIDLKRYGILVTCIAPGFIDTPLTRGFKHKKPFLLSQQEAARKIKYAIDAKKGFYVFPWQMRLLSMFLYHLPRPVYKWLLRTDPLGLAKN